MSTPFRKRLYPNLWSFFADLGFILKRSRKMKTLMGGEALSEQFRERLMLAVTEVNDCRYCSYFHTRQALSAGIPEEELQAIAASSFEGSPPDERPALVFAQHWAESDANPDPAAVQQMQARYSPEQMELIELCLRTIRMGNLSGNLLDYLLYKLSFGKIDLDRPPGMFSKTHPENQR